MKNLIFILVLTFTHGAQATCDGPLLTNAGQWVAMLKLGLEKGFVKAEDLGGIENLEKPLVPLKSKKFGESNWRNKLLELNQQMSVADWKRARVAAKLVVEKQLEIEVQKNQAEKDTSFIFALEYAEPERFPTHSSAMVIDPESGPIWLLLDAKIPSKMDASYIHIASDGMTTIHILGPHPISATTKLEGQFSSINEASIFYQDGFGKKSVFVELSNTAFRKVVWEIPLDPSQAIVTSKKIFDKQDIGVGEEWMARGGAWDLLAFDNGLSAISKKFYIVLRQEGPLLDNPPRYEFSSTHGRYFANPNGQAQLASYSGSGIVDKKITIFTPEREIILGGDELGIWIRDEKNHVSPWISGSRLLLPSYDGVEKTLLLVNPFAQDGKYLLEVLPVRGSPIMSPLTISHPRMGELIVVFLEDHVFIRLQDGSQVSIPWQRLTGTDERTIPVAHLSWVNEELIADIFYPSGLSRSSAHQRLKLYKREGAK